MSHRQQLADLLRKRSLFRGKFTLSSGKESDHYLDCKLTTLDPEGATLTGYAFLEALDALGVRADAIGGLSMGADPIVTAVGIVSYLEKRPLPGFLVRKERKKYGRQKQIEGIDDTPRNVVIVDEVCTTGGSTLEAIKAAEEAGHKVVAVLSLVDREEGGSAELKRRGYNYHAMFTAHELLGE